MIWNAASLAAPTSDVTILKNHDGLLRNCVYPVIKDDGTDLFVLVIAEYMQVSPDTHTGFIRYLINSDYSGFADPKERELKYINDMRLIVTGSFSPTASEWYTTAVSSTENYILYYSWGSSNIDMWPLTSNAQLHNFSHITGLTNDSANLPITGYYAGGTMDSSGVKAVQTNLGCTISFTNMVGHISQIELSSSSCLIESTSSSPSSPIQTHSGNGGGVECSEELGF